MVSRTQLERNIQKAVDQVTAEHYINAPGHAAALVEQVSGQLDALRTTGSDDPLLFAYECRDALPRLYGYLHAINQWAYAVTEAEPGDIPETGAQICPSTT